MFAVANFPVIEAHKIFLSMWTFLFISTTFFLWYLEPIPGGIIRCMHACYVLNRLDRFTVWERKYNNNKKKNIHFKSIYFWFVLLTANRKPLEVKRSTCWRLRVIFSKIRHCCCILKIKVEWEDNDLYFCGVNLTEISAEPLVSVLHLNVIVQHGHKCAKLIVTSPIYLFS